MPIAYSHDLYANKRILEAEEKVLNCLSDGKEHSVMELLEHINENKRMLERVLAAIRSYAGYTINMSKKTGVTMYRMVYDSSNDPYLAL